MQENAAGRWGLYGTDSSSGMDALSFTCISTLTLSILHGQSWSSCVAALPGGQRAISGSFASKALQEWDLESGACSAKFEVSPIG